MACVLQRQVREFKLPSGLAIRVCDFFLEDVRAGVWTVLPVSDPFLLRVASLVTTLPGALYLRAGDAVHLAAAREAGLSEIWSNDRRVIQAAPAFGLAGKSV